MKRAPFIAANAKRWEAFDASLAELEVKRGAKGLPQIFRRRGSAEPEGGETSAQRAERLRQLPREYRRLCRDCGLAEQRSYGEALTKRLNSLALRGYRQLYRRRAPLLTRIAAFACFDFPALVRREWRCVLLALALFALPYLALWAGIHARPDWVYYVLDAETIASMEAMYDPSAERTGRPSGDDAMMFGFYIRNNVGIAFRTFASGLLFGVGAIFFLFYNGLMIGAVFGHLSSSGYAETLYPFVVGHGSFELTAIVLAGAAGLKLGAALVAPGARTRVAAVVAAGRVSADLMWGVFAMLVIAAFIEGFWSPSGAAPAIKYAVGALLWTGVLAYFLLAGRRRAG